MLRCSSFPEAESWHKALNEDPKLKQTMLVEARRKKFTESLICEGAPGFATPELVDGATDLGGHKSVVGLGIDGLHDGDKECDCRSVDEREPPKRPAVEYSSRHEIRPNPYGNYQMPGGYPVMVPQYYSQDPVYPPPPLPWYGSRQGSIVSAHSPPYRPREAASVGLAGCDDYTSYRRATYPEKYHTRQGRNEHRRAAEDVRVDSSPFFIPSDRGFAGRENDRSHSHRHRDHHHQHHHRYRDSPRPREPSKHRHPSGHRRHSRDHHSSRHHHLSRHRHQSGRRHHSGHRHASRDRHQSRDSRLSGNRHRSNDRDRSRDTHQTRDSGRTRGRHYSGDSRQTGERHQSQENHCPRGRHNSKGRHHSGGRHYSQDRVSNEYRQGRGHQSPEFPHDRSKFTHSDHEQN